MPLLPVQCQRSNSLRSSISKPLNDLPVLDVVLDHESKTLDIPFRVQKLSSIRSTKMCFTDTSSPCICLVTPNAGCKIPSQGIRRSKPVSGNRLVYHCFCSKFGVNLLEEAPALCCLFMCGFVKNSQVCIDCCWWNSGSEDDNVE